MKATPFVPPVVALLAIGFWISPKWDALAAVDRKEMALSGMSGRASAGMTAGDGALSHRKVEELRSGKRFAWEKVSAEITENRISGRLVNMTTIEDTSLNHFLEKLSVEELVAELDEVARTEMDEISRRWIESRIFRLLIKKNPDIALTYAREKGAIARNSFVMKEALLQMAGRDPLAAAAWLDQQVAAGEFETKRLDGTNSLRTQLEGALLERMFTADRKAASSRLGEMSPGARMEVMTAIGEMAILNHHREAAYVELARRHLTPGECRKLLGITAWTMDSRQVDSFLLRIKATPEERSTICEMAAMGAISNKPLNGKLTFSDVVNTREWLDRTAPVEANRVIGQGLGKALEFGPASFSEIAAVAVKLREEDGNDEVLAAFLSSPGARKKKEEARTLAEGITDPDRKAEVLKTLE